jgi:anti-sigma B factor antagonist
MLVLHGPLLIANVPAFQQAAQKALSPNVCVDFADSSYMDSAGLGALLQLYRQLTTQQRHLVLVGLNQRIAALLKLTHADTLLDIRPTRDDLEKALA